MDVDLETMTAEHAPFLRRLAHALVGDHDGAEDLVQETWLAAAEQPRGNVRSPRAWLAGTARRLAASARRRRARGGRLGVDTEPPDDTGEPPRIAAALEAERALLAALETLPEAQQTAVWLRYREGLSVARISERVGAAPNTVRGRLRRGLALLRERLDESHGSPMTALAVLLPRGLDPSDRAALSAKRLAAARVWALGAVGVASVSIVVAALFGSNEPDRWRERAKGRDAAASARDLEPRQPSMDRGSRREQARRPSSAAAMPADTASGGEQIQPPGSTLDVHVIDEDSAPAAGARVWSVSGPRRRGHRVPADASISSGAGIATVPDRAGAIVTVFAASSELATDVRFGQATLVDPERAGSWPVEAHERGPSRAGPIDVVLRRAPFVAGRVVDRDGGGVAGVLVECTLRRDGIIAGSLSTKTDESGAFEWASIALHPMWSVDELVCDLRVFRSHQRRALLGDSSAVLLNTDGIEIVAHRLDDAPGAVVGELRTYDGRNAPADLRLNLNRAGPEAFTPFWIRLQRLDDGAVVPGNFRQDDVPPGSYELVARSEQSGYVGGVGDVQVVAGEVTDVGVVEVGPGGRIELVAALEPSARELPSEEVQRALRSDVKMWSSWTSAASLASRADGWRSTERIPPGEWRLDGRIPHPVFIDMEPITVEHGETTRARVRVRAARAVMLDVGPDVGATWGTMRIEAQELGAEGRPPVVLPLRTRGSVNSSGVTMSLPCHGRFRIRVTTDSGLTATTEVSVGGPGETPQRVEVSLGRSPGD